MPLDTGVWAGKRREHWGKGPGRELSRAPPCGNVGSLATKPRFPAPQLGPACRSLGPGSPALQVSKPFPELVSAGGPVWERFRPQLDYLSL